MNIFNEEELYYITKRLRNDSWYLNLPEDIKELVNKYPPGTYFDYKGERLYLVSYKEGTNQTAWGFGFSKINPGIDYERAKQELIEVCLNCFNKNILERCKH